MNKNLKKSAILSGIISLVLSGILFAVEGFFAFHQGTLPLCRELLGGECIEYIGIGWNILRLFPMSDGKTPSHSTSTVSFNPNIFLVFAIIWGVALSITLLMQKKED